jgi:fructokinase
VSQALALLDLVPDFLEDYLHMRDLITCMGECLIDFLPQQKDGATVGFSMSPAGSILNVAVGLRRLGQSTAFACKIGNDFFGRYLRYYIEKENIDTRFLLTAEARSTLAFVIVENGIPAFSFYGEGAADTLLTINDLPEALFTETRIIHCGSISLLYGTTPATVLATVERLKGSVLISFDPNIRPDLLSDRQSYLAIFQRLVALTDVLKLSEDDLIWLTPGVSSEQRATELLAQGPAIVIVTRGKAGVIAASKNAGIVSVPGFSVDVVDTVGCGDTFNAAFLARLAEEDRVSHTTVEDISPANLQEMLRFATAAAAVNCMRVGANPPTRAEVEQFLFQFSVS